jgi:sortase A
MKSTTEPATAPTRIRSLVRWTERLLFVTGIFALGYVGLTLIEARLYQVSAKRSLENQIQRQLETGELEKQPQEMQPKPPVKPGDLLGRLDIPRLSLSVAVLEGTGSRMLRLGTGHIESTPLPGEPGNSAIAGHRDTFFRGLKDIQKGDEIEFQTATGLFRYQVDWVKVVAPDETSVLAPSPESAITLVTCYPFYFVGPAPKRFVVRAHQDRRLPQVVPLRKRCHRLKNEESGSAAAPEM